MNTRTARTNPTAHKPGDWSEAEISATVADYFEMLACEARGQLYSKADHRRCLTRALNERSPAAIEFKHANISAVLDGLGHPYIAGYKPRRNYQAALYEAVKRHIFSQ